MVDINNLRYKFGEEVVNLNLDGKDLFVYDETGSLPEDALDRINHLINSGFDNIEEVLSFISDSYDADIDLNSESLALVINESLKRIREYRIGNPFFSPEDVETWDDDVNSLFNDLETILNDNGIVNGMEVSGLFENRAEISNEQIKKMIYEDMDENSILMLYGVVTNNFVLEYEPSMRYTVFNNVKNNREKSEAGRLVLGLLNENSVKLSSILKKHGFGLCKDIQKCGVYVLNEDKKIYSVIHNGNNKYLIS